MVGCCSNSTRLVSLKFFNLDLTSFHVTSGGYRFTRWGGGKHNLSSQLESMSKANLSPSRNL